jgi:imidazolonepropionase-like amidohydrolase
MKTLIKTDASRAAVNGNLMKKMFALLLIILFPVSSIAQENQTVQNRPVVFRNVTLIDMRSEQPQPNMTVIVSGNRITNVSKKVKIPKDAQIIDAGGKFLIPGLWDMHTHALREDRIGAFFPLFIANGVTGIRDMAMPLANLELLKQWRKEIEQGTRTGPRIFASGATLGGVRPQLTITVTTEDEVRRAVATLKQKGADFVKVYSLLPRSLFFVVADEAKKEGLTFVGHVPVSVTATEASDAGLKSIEHLYGVLESCSTNEAEIRKEVEQAASNPDLWRAWGAVVRTTDSLYGRQAREKTYSREKCSALFDRFVKNGTWQCPTLVLRRAFALREDDSFRNDVRIRYMSQSEVNSWNVQTDTRNANLAAEEIANRKIRLEKETELVGEMHRAGVRILAGTDLGNPYVYPGFSLHDELALLVQAGLTPLEALQTATVNPAKFLGKEKELGTVEKGKLADLVLLDANPLEDIRNTARIAAVVTNGRYLAKADLQKLLSDVEAANSPETELNKKQSVLFDFGTAPNFEFLSNAARVCD